jgi:glycosyltransferase involved in cell wall biosynthesis
MKILITHRYFWPDTVNCGQILWSLTQHFNSEGHKVEVITSLPSYNLNSLKIYAKKNENLNNIRIRRINLVTEGKSPFKKFINGLKLGIMTNYLAIRNNYDMIISTSIPPITGGFFGALAAYITKAKFVYFCMDLHPEIGKISNDFSNPFLYALLKKIDNWSCSRANPVVVHSLDMKNSLTLRNKKNHFIIKIINNFSITDEKNHKLISKKNFKLDNDTLNIIFAGNLGRFQALENIIDAMALLKNRQDIKLILVGEGSAKTELVSKLKKIKANVDVYDRQPVHIVKDMIKKADIGLVSLSSNVYKYGYPGKIMTYLEQGKPIITIIEKESEIVKLMELENYGFCIPTLEPKKISEKLIKISENKSWKTKMSANAINSYKKYFTKDKILSKWSDILAYK